MGDAEPPSKKRAAGRELSRDNPGLDDEDEEVLGQETGTFKRASDEVLANRRIVRVKRSQTSSTPSAPSSNPFAAIRLVPSTNPTPIPAFNSNLQETEKPASEKTESPSSVNKRPADNDDDDVKQPQTKENDENTPVVEKENGQNKDRLVENDVTRPAAEKEIDERKDEFEGNDENTFAAEKENGENKTKLLENDEDTPAAKKDNEEKEDMLEENDENTPAAGSVNSFQHLSSSQNAFTGLVGTGFSSSTFSFGSITKTDPPAFPSFSFGTNGNSSLFGDPNKTEAAKIPSMQEVHVETGEENEKTVFTADSALYEFLDGGWKERGKGEVKVNVLTSGMRKARLVMRARGNYRLILNASIFPDMKLTNMEKKGITFACVNSRDDKKDGLSTFALKFKDGSIVEEFREVVMAHKSSPSAPTLKTPENSPKGSADE